MQKGQFFLSLVSIMKPTGQSCWLASAAWVRRPPTWSRWSTWATPAASPTAPSPRRWRAPPTATLAPSSTAARCLPSTRRDASTGSTCGRRSRRCKVKRSSPPLPSPESKFLSRQLEQQLRSRVWSPHGRGHPVGRPDLLADGRPRLRRHGDPHIRRRVRAGSAPAHRGVQPLPHQAGRGPRLHDRRSAVTTIATLFSF